MLKQHQENQGKREVTFWNDVKGVFAILAGILLTLSVQLSSVAARTTQNSLRCPGSTGLISIGDTESEVLDKCGEPTSIEKMRVPGVYYGNPGEMGHEEYRTQIAREGAATQKWTYDFGPNKFVYYLSFQEGELYRIESGGYGD
jgi:hypothetical protein